jgi:hypothetical protein
LTTKEEYKDVIEQLDLKGIHFNRYDEKNEEIHFKCSINPYLPTPLKFVMDLLHQIGNGWVFDGSNKTLVIKNTNFSYPKKQKTKQ